MTNPSQSTIEAAVKIVGMLVLVDMNTSEPTRRLHLAAATLLTNLFQEGTDIRESSLVEKLKEVLNA